MIPNFENKDELLAFVDKDLKGDKHKLYAMKKATMKYADAVSYYLPKLETIQDSTIKEESVMKAIDTNKINVKAVINTTNILDSHGDVHINGLWKKSISESKNMMLLQEHQMKFDKVISDEVEMSTKNMSWKSLGFDYEGTTQALIFDATISKDKYNEMMFEMYSANKVRNHSVGMRYMKVLFAVDSTDKYWQEEKETYDKYIDQIVNKEDVQGFFTVVLEAKVIEGSAVLRGSNVVTPTLSVTETKEADNVTSLEIEPTIVTPTPMDWVKIINNIKTH
jgi:hypothetical protein